MIYDTDGDVLTSAAISIDIDDEKTFSALVDCVAGYNIRATAVNAGVGVDARANPGDAWTDILAGPLAIGAFAPERRQFYFRITTEPGTDPATEIVRITVGQA